MNEAFPFISTNTATLEAELPLYREYAWNFDTDHFIYDSSGKHVLVEGNEALKVWIYKALKTERFRYTAYSWQYGIELKKFIGKVMTVGERISEFKRTVIECFMVNPYIKSINSISITREKTKLNCEINLTTVYGELVINV